MAEIARTYRWAHTPASFGVEIRETVNGETTECSLTNPRGTDALWFAMKTDDGTWTPVQMVAQPERFMSQRCTSQADFKRVVDAWNEASDKAITEAEAEGNL